MKVEVYATQQCPKCKDVARYLDNKEIEYMYMIVGRDVLPQQLSEVVGRPVRSVPIILLNGQEIDFEGLKGSVECREHRESTEMLAEGLTALSV